MKQENNFEVKNIDLEEMNQIVEIKDDELKEVTGGNKGTFTLAPYDEVYCLYKTSK